MTIRVTCPSCATPVEAPDRAIGKAVRCPSCQAAIPVRAAGAPSAVAPSKAATAAIKKPTKTASDLNKNTRPAPNRRAAASGTARGTADGKNRSPLVIGGVAMAALVLLGIGGWMLTKKPAAEVASTSIATAPAPQASVLASSTSTVAPTAAVPLAASAPMRSANAPLVAEAHAASSPALTHTSANGTATAPSAKVIEQRLFTAGSSGDTSFLGALALSNGDLLICGSTDDLAWTGTAARTELSATGITGGAGDRYGFVLHLSPDLATIKKVYHLPKGAANNIMHLRSTEVPGATTGTVYLSGGCTGLTPQTDGYFLMRLNGDALGAKLTAQWATFVPAPASKSSGFKGEGNYKLEQRWDVTNDGRVIAASGCAFDFDWAELRVIGADGKPTTLAGWPTKDGRSFIALKAISDSGLRSKTQDDFDVRQVDENGNPGRKGRYPDDYYFSGPGQGGPGYTGYKVSGKPTQRVGRLAIDRRDNFLYFGYSTQTKLPNGNPDFEPAIVAMDAAGKLLWWARGYKEVERTADNAKGNQDGLNSPPDQHIDGVGIDYANDRLVVVARSHGGGVINYWNGDAVQLNKGRAGFQIKQTGSNGNIHVSWIGQYGMRDGKLYASTWMAELAEGAKIGKPLTEGPLIGWPSPNGGWPDVNTTRIADVVVDHRGRPCVAAVGRRPYTTAGALIENVKPSAGKSAWAPFARVYDQDLGALAYSTILRGPWDTTTGTSSDAEIDLAAIIPLADGVLVVGRHTRGKTGEEAKLPVVGVPSWGAAVPPGKTVSGVIAVLRVPVSP